MAALHSLPTRDLLAIVRDGLGNAGLPPKRVIVLGAGMAGLVAASELRRAGHEVVLLEARARVGGRVQTLREPFAPGLYAEAGAMRIPSSHQLTMAYIARYGLQTVPMTGAYANDLVFFNGRRAYMSEIEAHPHELGFEAAAFRREQTILERWAEVVEDAAAHAEDDAYWQALAARHGDCSLREFLARDGWSEEAIVAFGLLTTYEVILSASFIDSLRSDVALHDAHLVQISGGMDGLPRAFLPELQGCLRFGAEVTALAQSPAEVTVHFTTAAGRAEVHGARAIVTLPFPALRFIEVTQPFSIGKQRAIRGLPYMAAAKVLLQFRRRFWEDDDGIVGGSTATDLPIRLIYYPEHGRETGRGVLLASYTWGEDAERWGSLPPLRRIGEAVRQLACIHPQAAEEVEAGTSVIWHEDRFAGGAFAFFEPGQETRLHAHIVAPEGRIHFAGEHTSLKHAWIEGAVESGLRAALEVHQAPA
ncbi:MAG TPA: flavin monoamine oxidase family protein [Dehalococcoidia bacterium]|jgi:monoamine oxidase